MLDSINISGLPLIFNRIMSIILSVLLVCLLPLSSVYASDKQTIGWIENVIINGSNFKLKAKIDTGATTSSLNAKILKKFKKNGEKWVRFRIRSKVGQKILFERKVLRTVKIKHKLALVQKRPVVNLGVCLGKVYQVLEVNLADRKNFVYQMLIGRNFLQGLFIVDPDSTFTTKPTCKK